MPVVFVRLQKLLLCAGVAACSEKGECGSNRLDMKQLRINPNDFTLDKLVADAVFAEARVQFLDCSISLFGSICAIEIIEVPRGPIYDLE